MGFYKDFTNKNNSNSSHFNRFMKTLCCFNNKHSERKATDDELDCYLDFITKIVFNFLLLLIFLMCIFLSFFGYKNYEENVQIVINNDITTHIKSLENIENNLKIFSGITFDDNDKIFNQEYRYYLEFFSYIFTNNLYLESIFFCLAALTIILLFINYLLSNKTREVINILNYFFIFSMDIFIGSIFYNLNKESEDVIFHIRLIYFFLFCSIVFVIYNFDTTLKDIILIFLYKLTLLLIFIFTYKKSNSSNLYLFEICFFLITFLFLAIYVTIRMDYRVKATELYLIQKNQNEYYQKLINLINKSFLSLNVTLFKLNYNEAFLNFLNLIGLDNYDINENLNYTTNSCTKDKNISTSNQSNLNVTDIRTKFNMNLNINNNSISENENEKSPVDNSKSFFLKNLELNNINLNSINKSNIHYSSIYNHKIDENKMKKPLNNNKDKEEILKREIIKNGHLVNRNLYKNEELNRIIGKLENTHKNNELTTGKKEIPTPSNRSPINSINPNIIVNDSFKMNEKNNEQKHKKFSQTIIQKKINRKMRRKRNRNLENDEDIFLQKLDFLLDEVFSCFVKEESEDTKAIRASKNTFLLSDIIREIFYDKNNIDINSEFQTKGIFTSLPVLKSKIVIELNYRRIHTFDGELIEFYINDISEMRRNESEKIKNIFKNKVLPVALHEIKLGYNLINFIIKNIVSIKNKFCENNNENNFIIENNYGIKNTNINRNSSNNVFNYNEKSKKFSISSIGLGKFIKKNENEKNNDNKAEGNIINHYKRKDKRNLNKLSFEEMKSNLNVTSKSEKKFRNFSKKNNSLENKQDFDKNDNINKNFENFNKSKDSTYTKYPINKYNSLGNKSKTRSNSIDFLKITMQLNEFFIGLTREIIDYTFFYNIQSSSYEFEYNSEISGFNLFETLYFIYDILKVLIHIKGLKDSVTPILEVDQNIPELFYSDKKRIEEILLNLINNSIKYTKNGYIKISAEVDFDKDLKEVSSFNYVKISVEDSGLGIQPEKMNNMVNIIGELDIISKNDDDNLSEIIKKNKENYFINNDKNENKNNLNNQENKADFNKQIDFFFKKEKEVFNFKNKNFETKNTILESQGQGLMISNQILKKIGKGINCFSQPNEKTNFSFILDNKIFDSITSKNYDFLNKKAKEISLFKKKNQKSPIELLSGIGGKNKNNTSNMNKTGFITSQQLKDLSNLSPKRLQIPNYISERFDQVIQFESNKNPKNSSRENRLNLKGLNSNNRVSLSKSMDLFNKNSAFDGIESKNAIKEISSSDDNDVFLEIENSKENMHIKIIDEKGNEAEKTILTSPKDIIVKFENLHNNNKSIFKDNHNRLNKIENKKKEMVKKISIIENINKTKKFTKLSEVEKNYEILKEILLPMLNIIKNKNKKILLIVESNYENRVVIKKEIKTLLENDHFKEKNNTNFKLIFINDGIIAFFLFHFQSLFLSKNVITSIIFSKTNDINKKKNEYMNIFETYHIFKNLLLKKNILIAEDIKFAILSDDFNYENSYSDSILNKTSDISTIKEFEILRVSLTNVNKNKDFFNFKISNDIKNEINNTKHNSEKENGSKMNDKNLIDFLMNLG